MTTSTLPIAKPNAWSAIGSMTMCTAMLIAAEFMPVSLLTPIAHDLAATEGGAGQAISVSGLFAVAASLLIAPVASRFNRRSVLMALTLIMAASLALIAVAPNFPVLIASRALLGITIGGFWSLATATVMRLVPEEAVPKALGIMYMGNSAASAFAAPIGAYLGALVGWRGVFWALVPLVMINFIWQWLSLPSMPPQQAIPVSRIMGLLKRRQVVFAMVGAMLTWGGAFTVFTYFRPFLESYTQVDVTTLSALLLALGAGSFAGTYVGTALLKKHLYTLVWGLPLALAMVSSALIPMGHLVWGVAAGFAVWGALNAALPVAWFNWLAREVRDEPEAGGGLMVGAIQVSIMVGAGLGGLLLDHVSIAATFFGGSFLMLLAAVIVSKRERLQVP